VWKDKERIGELRETGNLWSFAYDPSWHTSPDAFALSPSLPLQDEQISDGASQRPVQWFFDNLLPEEGERTLLAHDAGIDAADAFGLLQRYGPESAGALTLLAPGEILPASGLVPLSNHELSERIHKLPQVPLSHDAPKRMSMAGAQHKLAVVLDNDQLFEPKGRTASTHILKPDHPQPDHYAHSAINEWFVMRLAEAVGLNVPSVSLRRVPEPVYLIERFDREGETANARRRHVLDACQLLSLDRRYKYEQATAQTFRKLAELCRAKASTRQAIFRWSIFNVLVGNSDAHLKNLSFYLSRKGIALAPHYDLISTSIYKEASWLTERLVTPMGGAEQFGDLRRAHVQDYGNELGIPAKVSARLLDDMLLRMERRASGLLEHSQRDEVLVASPGEARLLRAIAHGPIKDLSQQLR
jgi:serine/threonine-protein kinase HipA